MLSTKIDLTANRDFSGGNGIFFDTPIEFPDDREWMTSDEYERLLWWEGIFGRRRHRNEKGIVFGEDNKYFSNLRSYCCRCGKPFRIPWDNYGGVCRKCDSEGYERGEKWRIPWAQHYGMRIDVAYNLFNSR
jgi:hypothetical protein